MRDTDFDSFGQLLDAVCSLLSRGSYTPNATNSALFFRSLSEYSLDAVRAGFDAHVKDPQRGRFVPMPADMIAQIEGLVADDGRPGADEAWAVAIRAADENATVVWTEEIAKAWGIARAVFDAGDEVGARVAFREAYNRLTDEARRARRPAKWDASLGFEPSGRASAIQEAVAIGRLPAPDRYLLEGPATSDEPSPVLGELFALRERLVMRHDDGPSPDLEAKQDTQRLKDETAERVEAYRREHGE